MADEQKTAGPGWYDHYGGKRFFDGERWTDAYAYTSGGKAWAPSSGFSFFMTVAAAVVVGVLVALFVVRLGADADPDTFFFPVKFVVDPSSLPSSFR